MKNNYFKNETKPFIVEGKTINIKEYKGKRVVTVWDISNIHDKEVRKINELFKKHKNRFVENEDFFSLTPKEFSESFLGTQDFIPNNVKEINVFTEKGYLKITKPFTDDLSWKVNEILVKSYFRLKQIQKQEVIPQDYASALRKCADLYEEKLKLEETNQKLKTFELTMKAKFKSGKTYTTTELAKQFNIKSAHAMHKILEKLNLIENYFITDADNNQIKIWKLTKEYENKGYDYLENLSFKGKKYLKWTDKGIYLICNMLNDLELLDENLDIITWNDKLNNLMYKANDKIEQIIDNYYLNKNK